MDWLMANMGTIIMSILLIVLVFFLVRSTLKSRNQGCGGCSGCSGCSACRTKEMKKGRGNQNETE